MGKSAAVYLKTPSQRQATLQLEFYLSEEHLRAVEAVVLTLDLGGKLLDRQKYEEAGLYTYRTAIPREQLRGPMVCLGLSVDRTFQVPSDKRVLGLAVFRVGFPGAVSVRPMRAGLPANPAVSSRLLTRHHLLTSNAGW